MIGIATSRMVGINISRLRYLRKRIATSSYSTTLIADDETDIIIGDASTDLQIRVVYYAVRGSLGQSGEMIVESPYNNYVVPEVQNDYFYDDVGITTLTPSINGDGRIVLTITVDDSSVDDVEFGYNLEVVKSVKDERIFDDWFLPSKDELQAMYDNLYLENVGGLTLYNYWSSSHTNDGNPNARGLTMETGGWGTYTKSTQARVRACRVFQADEGSYSLRDEGQAGGLIFYIDGSDHYEAAPSDISGTSIWSNVATVLSTTLDDIGEGVNNTAEIIAQSGHTTSAAKLCNDFEIIA